MNIRIIEAIPCFDFDLVIHAILKDQILWHLKQKPQACKTIYLALTNLPPSAIATINDVCPWAQFVTFIDRQYMNAITQFVHLFLSHRWPAADNRNALIAPILPPRKLL